jgi:hypothetical protein
LVPRAKTTSMSGQPSADASPIGIGDTAEAKTAAEAVKVAAAEAISQRRIRFKGTSDDNAEVG